MENRLQKISDADGRFEFKMAEEEKKRSEINKYQQHADKLKNDLRSLHSNSLGKTTNYIIIISTFTKQFRLTEIKRASWL